MKDRSLLTRKQYEAYKKYDRQDFEEMLSTFVQNGRVEGINSFVEFIMQRPGVGPKTKSIINTALKEFLEQEV